MGPGPGGAEAQAQPPVLRFPGIGLLQLVEDGLQGRGQGLGIDPGHIQAGDVEQGVQQFRHAADGGADLAGQLFLVRAPGVVLQVGGEQVEGVQGLPQVVAGGSQEAGLGQA